MLEERNAVITNANVEKHNAFDDAMDLRLFEILGELKANKDVRAVVWRGEGKSFSSGRDVAAIGGHQVELTHHELMSRGHQGILQIFDIEAPIERFSARVRNASELPASTRRCASSRRRCCSMASSPSRTSAENGSARAGPRSPAATASRLGALQNDFRKRRPARAAMAARMPL